MVTVCLPTLVRTTLLEACLNAFYVCETNVINTEITG